MTPAAFRGKNIPMDRKDALGSLETIRAILERSTRLTHIAPGGILASGMAAVGASIIGALLGIDPRRPAAFLVLWALVLAFALGAGVGLSARMARRRGELFWGRKLRFVASGVLPSAVGAILVTAALIDAGRLDLGPGTWMVSYGIAILSIGMVLDWEYRAAGWAFLVAGSLALFLFRGSPHLSMGITFGGIHAALGAFRFAMEGVEECHVPLPSAELIS